MNIVYLKNERILFTYIIYVYVLNYLIKYIIIILF